MRRFDPFLDGIRELPTAGMEECMDGDYVLFDDVCDMLKIIQIIADATIAKGDTDLVQAQELSQRIIASP